MNSWRDLEQDVSRMDEISALKLLAMRLVVAPAFRFGGRRDLHLFGKQALDGPCDFIIIDGVREEKATRNSALPQQLAHNGDLGVRPQASINRDAIDADIHERTGNFARVCGVRTI